MIAGKPPYYASPQWLAKHNKGNGAWLRLTSAIGYQSSYRLLQILATNPQ